MGTGTATIDANAGTGGNQVFSFLGIADAAFTGAGQLRFRYEVIGSQEYTVIEGNINANLDADFQVALLGHVGLQAVDVVL